MNFSVTFSAPINFGAIIIMHMQCSISRGPIELARRGAGTAGQQASVTPQSEEVGHDFRGMRVKLSR